MARAEVARIIDYDLRLEISKQEAEFLLTVLRHIGGVGRVRNMSDKLREVLMKCGVEPLTDKISGTLYLEEN